MPAELPVKTLQQLVALVRLQAGAALAVGRTPAEFARFISPKRKRAGSR